MLTLTDSSDEKWIVVERVTIKDAAALRIDTWRSLRLRVADRSDDLKVARAVAAVDRCLQKAAAH
jgi:hypothetical protein